MGAETTQDTANETTQAAVCQFDPECYFFGELTDAERNTSKGVDPTDRTPDFAGCSLGHCVAKEVIDRFITGDNPNA